MENAMKKIWILTALVLTCLSCTTVNIGTLPGSGFTVNFVDSDGSALNIPSQTIPKGGKVVLPKAPVRPPAFIKPGLYLGPPNYVFDGWYYEKCTPRWDFIRHTVEKNMTLIAQWDGPEPIPTVRANDLASAFTHINANNIPGAMYTLVLNADIAAETQIFSAPHANLNIIGIDGVQTILYTGGGNGTLFTLRSREGTLTIGTNILLKNLTALERIAPGRFEMGSLPSEQGRRQGEVRRTVRLTQAFFMGKYPITQELYRFVMGTNPSVFQHAAAGETLSAQAVERRPVDRVSFYAALVFCNRLSKLEGLEPVYTISGSTDPEDWGVIPSYNNMEWNAVIPNWAANGYRLPTEAEWEYACRAGTSTAWNTGASINTDTGWYSANSGFANNRGSTREVGGKPANAWRLFDMHGNVFEWVWDWYAAYELTDGAVIIDPRGPRSSPPINRRVLRGGAWNRPAERLRSASRNYGEPYHACSEDGLRVARSVP
jgi:uncharacterized repeat protein (TIGR02543 family)